MNHPPCGEECRRILVDGFAERGADVHVTHLPPLFPTGYEPLNLSCPHGVHWYAEPTAEQRVRWAQDGTP